MIDPYRERRVVWLRCHRRHFRKVDDMIDTDREDRPRYDDPPLDLREHTLYTSAWLFHYITVKVSRKKRKYNTYMKRGV